MELFRRTGCRRPLFTYLLPFLEQEGMGNLYSMATSGGTRTLQITLGRRPYRFICPGFPIFKVPVIRLGLPKTVSLQAMVSGQRGKTIFPAMEECGCVTMTTMRDVFTAMEFLPGTVTLRFLRFEMAPATTILIGESSHPVTGGTPNYNTNYDVGGGVGWYQAADGLIDDNRAAVDPNAETNAYCRYNGRAFRCTYYPINYRIANANGTLTLNVKNNNITPFSSKHSGGANLCVCRWINPLFVGKH